MARNQNRLATISVSSAQFAQGQLEDMIRDYGILTTITLLVDAVEEQTGEHNRITVELQSETIKAQSD